MTPGFKALSSRRPVRQNKDTQGLSTVVRIQEPHPLTSVRPRAHTHFLDCGVLRLPLFHPP